MADRIIPETEYILNPDGTLYHIHLANEHVAGFVILVGDPGRVQEVSSHFDTVEHRSQNREFITHTGHYKNKRITVMSTGIGTDNIDIVVNELDAAVNIDPRTRKVKANKRKLNLIRIGTSGALHADIPVGAPVISSHGLGLDGLVHYYQYPFNTEETNLQDKIKDHLDWDEKLPKPYVATGSSFLISGLGQGMVTGITATAPGFYGPQGRSLRLPLRHPDLNEKLQTFRSGSHRITNFEMETSALYALGKMLGHECCTICSIIANRARKEYSKDAHGQVNNLIGDVLDRIASL